jgi:putative ABC transport system substrate-binding protein
VAAFVQDTGGKCRTTCRGRNRLIADFAFAFEPFAIAVLIQPTLLRALAAIRRYRQQTNRNQIALDVSSPKLPNRSWHRAVQQATKTIPILGVTEDIVGEGFVDSLVRPNGNTTGISILATELDCKRQEILVEAVPELRRMAVLADSNSTTDAKLHLLEDGARAHNIKLSIYRIAVGSEISSAIDAAHAMGTTALNVMASPMLFANRNLIMDRVATLRWPAIYQWQEMAEEGGFAAYGPRLNHIVEIVVRLAVKLLNGVKPADLPVEQPTKFELWINLKTAKAMGVTVPEALLVRADKVIE